MILVWKPDTLLIEHESSLVHTVHLSSAKYIFKISLVHDGVRIHAVFRKTYPFFGHQSNNIKQVHIVL